MAIYDLTMRSPLHQGEFLGINRESVLEWIPSDTLFSAFIASLADQKIDITSLLDAYKKNQPPPFLITSAFPRSGNVRFLPAPPRLPAHSGLYQTGGGKAAKKIRWLSSEVFTTLQQGKTPDAENENFIDDGKIWLTSAEKKQVSSLLNDQFEEKLSPWKRQVVPHATIGRTNATSNLFHSGEIVYGPDCGLWFAVRGDPKWIECILPYLEDTGLGGLRSTGHGAFSWKRSEDAFPDVDEGWGISLSRYAPSSEEEIKNSLQAPQSIYQFVTVGGWCQDETGHSWRRRSIRMVAEGAILPAGTKGKLVDVQPVDNKVDKEWGGIKHSIYRSGLAFLIPAGKFVEAV
jgi:CRISPR-associated protein Csm4